MWMYRFGNTKIRQNGMPHSYVDCLYRCLCMQYKIVLFGLCLFRDYLVLYIIYEVIEFLPCSILINIPSCFFTLTLRVTRQNEC